MIEEIKKALLDARKAKDEIRKGTLQVLVSRLQLTAKEKKADLSDAEVLQIVQKEIKQLNDAMVSFKQANRVDLIQKTEIELELLNSFLPKQLSPEELLAVAHDVAKEIGFDGTVKQKGVLIKAIMAKVGSQTVGKVVNDAVDILIKG